MKKLTKKQQIELLTKFNNAVNEASDKALEVIDHVLADLKLDPKSTFMLKGRSINRLIMGFYIPVVGAVEEREHHLRRDINKEVFGNQQPVNDECQ